MSVQGEPIDGKATPAASSSKVPASKKPVKAKVVVPTNLRSEHARLSFKSADSTQWVVLPCIGKTNKNNVGPAVFNGDILITQKAKGNRCTLRLRNSDYSLQGNRFVLGSADDDDEPMFVGHFTVIRPGICSIDTDKGDDEGIALASTCPLARLSSTFTDVRLAVPTTYTYWKTNEAWAATKPDVLRGQLTHLCTVPSLANRESNWSKVLKTDMKALLSESKARRNQLGVMKCRIVTHAGKGNRSVIVEVFPLEPPKDRSVDAKEYDWESKKVGESYELKAYVNFSADEDTLREHKIFGGRKTARWEMTVVKNKMGYKAPIVGVISNSFDDISSFVGLEEHEVALEPIYYDILGERVRSTISTVETAIDDFKAELNDFFSNPRYPPQMPAVEFFGLEECDQEAHKMAIQIELPLSLRSRSIRLNSARSKRSSIAKSLSLGAPLAPAQISAQYATGELDSIDEECHLETLRVRRARTEGRFTGFLDAVDQLQEYGSLKDEAVHDAYMEGCKELTRMVLEGGIRIVFCTVTGCQSPALYKVHVADNKIVWAYPAKSAFLDDANTMTRPMMEILVMAFVKTLQRFSIAGDPYQLPAFTLSPIAKIEWHIHG